MKQKQFLQCKSDFLLGRPNCSFPSVTLKPPFATMSTKKNAYFVLLPKNSNR